MDAVTGTGTGVETSSPPTIATTESTTPKLRLMCSYGGQILPRPHDKTLSYIGGETRLILSDRNVSLSDLIARLSKTLLPNKPFSLKYQLPTEDLDSLISVSTDEDLDNMIDEYDRLLKPSSKAPPTRIRLFLFTDQSGSGSSFRSDKSEEWFLNALNGSGTSRMADLDLDLPKSTSVNCLLGLDDVVSNGNGKEVVVRKQDVHSVPDSPIMDTSSSFGSTSSSPVMAMANLAPIRVKVEEQKTATVVGVEERKQEDGGFFVVSSAVETTAVVRVPATVAEMASPDSLSSDSSLTNPLTRQRNMIYQDPALQFQMQNQNQSTPSNRATTPVDPKLSDSNPNYLFPTQYEQQFQQLNAHHQPPHYIQPTSQYIPQGAVPAPAYYILYPPQQQYPSAYVSARPNQPTYSMQSSYAPSMGSSQNPQQFMGYPPIHHQSQSIAPSSIAATGNYKYEYADPANPRVVYTQQMAPQVSAQYQNASPVLSETSAQVPNESFKQQTRAAQL